MVDQGDDSPKDSLVFFSYSRNQEFLLKMVNSRFSQQLMYFLLITKSEYTALWSSGKKVLTVVFGLCLVNETLISLA